MAPVPRRAIRGVSGAVRPNDVDRLRVWPAPADVCGRCSRGPIRGARGMWIAAADRAAIRRFRSGPSAPERAPQSPGRARLPGRTRRAHRTPRRLRRRRSRVAGDRGRTAGCRLKRGGVATPRFTRAGDATSTRPEGKAERPERGAVAVSAVDNHAAQARGQRFGGNQFTEAPLIEPSVVVDHEHVAPGSGADRFQEHISLARVHHRRNGTCDAGSRDQRRQPRRPQADRRLSEAEAGLGEAGRGPVERIESNKGGGSRHRPSVCPPAQRSSEGGQSPASTRLRGLSPPAPHHGVGFCGAARGSAVGCAGTPALGIRRRGPSVRTQCPEQVRGPCRATSPNVCRSSITARGEACRPGTSSPSSMPNCAGSPTTIWPGACRATLSRRPRSFTRSTCGWFRAAMPPDDRRRFVAIAAHVMREILIEHARSRGRLKRGGDRERVGRSPSCRPRTPSSNAGRTWIAPSTGWRPRSAPGERRGVAILRRPHGRGDGHRPRGVSKTVKRDWSVARAWLRRELDV